MWSGVYNYYSIQSDLEFTRKETSSFVAKILNQTEKLIQTNHQSFINKDSFPWVQIIIVMTKDGGYSSTENELPFVNLISIACRNENEIEQKIYFDTFLKVARELNWKLYLEHDDNGNDYIEIT
jgi:hypothetical protein